MVSGLQARSPAPDRAGLRLRHPPGAGRARSPHNSAGGDRHRHDPGAAAREPLRHCRRGEHPHLPRRTHPRIARSRSASPEGGESAPPLPGGGMRMLATSYTLSDKTTLPFEEAVERVREELKAEGFGVLCEIDVRSTLKQKLGVEREPYMILGACNPPLANQALEAEPELGALLPCNVIVYRRDGETHISAVDAERMLSIVGNERLALIAADVRRRLADVVARSTGKNGHR